MKQDRQPNNIELYFQYLPVYLDVKHNPRKYAALKDHPGMKWYRHTRWIFVLAYLLLHIIASAKRSGLY